MRLQLSSRLIVTMVTIQLVVLFVLVWNNQRVFKESHVERMEVSYSTEQAHLAETVSIGLVYADRAMLKESLEHLKARDDFGFAVISDRKGRVMATSGDVPENLSLLDFNLPYEQTINDGGYYISSSINKNGMFLGMIQVGFTTNHVQQRLSNARSQNIYIAIAAFLITLTASIILGRYISSNLRLLEQGAKKFSSGDFGYRIKPVNEDSIDDVVSSFNSLAAKLQDSIEDLSYRNQLLFESKEQVSLLLDSTAEAIYGIDKQGRCTFANPTTVKLLGYKSTSDLIGHNMHKLFHHSRPDGTPYPEDECPIYHVSRTGNGINVDTEVFWRADGSSFPAEYWSHPIISDGEITGTVVTFLDISERRQAEEGLRRSQKMDAIGQLTGGIAHDFNNLLGIILGNLEMLTRHKALDDKSSKYIKSITKASQRAANLTKQLLGFSRSKSSNQTVTDINRVISAMDTLIARSLTPEIELVQQFDKELWLTNVDPGDFEDALLNLCINARDAMQGHGQLTVETRNVTLDTIYCQHNPDATPGDYVEISISDAGKGIPAEQIEHIFEPFFTTKEEGKGTGLGLAMVFGFIKRSQGSISVYSELDIGTTFKLYLPRVAEERQPYSESRKQGAVLPSGHETILAVDDEEALVSIAKELLEEQGYRVLTAMSGDEALQQLASDSTIELLFSDVVMPGGMNGYELAEKATKSNPALKVLLTSGYTKNAVKQNDQSYFDTKLLSKPYNQSDLLNQIRDALDN